MEELAGDKHSSFLQKFAIYGQKKFYNIGPRTAIYGIIETKKCAVPFKLSKHSLPQTQCNTDTFSVTGPAASVPPVICGTNSGSHSNYLNKLDRFAIFTL